MTNTTVAERLAKLETHAEYTREQTDKILINLSAIGTKLVDLPCGEQKEKIINLGTNQIKLMEVQSEIVKFKERLSGKFAMIAIVIMIGLQIFALAMSMSR